MHVASWRAAYAGLIDQAVLDAQSVDARESMWASWIVRSDAGLPPVGHHVLWVLHGNDRAARFYERHGWVADGGEKIADAGGAKDLRELRHSRRLSGGVA